VPSQKRSSNGAPSETQIKDSEASAVGVSGRWQLSVSAVGVSGVHFCTPLTLARIWKKDNMSHLRFSFLKTGQDTKEDEEIIQTYVPHPHPSSLFTHPMILVTDSEIDSVPCDAESYQEKAILKNNMQHILCRKERKRCIVPATLGNNMRRIDGE